MIKVELAFQTYYRPLCLYAIHYLHDVAEAEDMVQDCFVRLLEKDATLSFPSQERLKSFLYTSVRNACVDRLRRQHPIVQDISPSDLSGSISDDEARERSFSEAELWTAIEQLPDRCREIFLLSKRDGLTYREIAEELSLSEKTVEHQVSKALKLLRNQRADIYYVIAFF